jgi:hypothetical protein
MGFKTTRVRVKVSSKSSISKRVQDTRRSKRNKLKPRLQASATQAGRLEGRPAPEG